MGLASDFHSRCSFPGHEEWEQENPDDRTLTILLSSRFGGGFLFFAVLVNWGCSTGNAGNSGEWLHSSDQFGETTVDLET